MKTKNTCSRTQTETTVQTQKAQKPNGTGACVRPCVVCEFNREGHLPPTSLCPLFQVGRTALISASRNDHVSTVELLLAAGAKTNIQDKVSLLLTQRKRERLHNAYTCLLPPSGAPCSLKAVVHGLFSTPPLKKKAASLAHPLDEAAN